MKLTLRQIVVLLSPQTHQNRILRSYQANVMLEFSFLWLSLLNSLRRSAALEYESSKNPTHKIVSAV
jgi:hypothetical protein